MSNVLSLAMILAIATGAPDASHTIVVPHASGKAQVEYRGNLAIEHRQVGSVAPGGRASTLRCRWTANLHVERNATHTSGSTASRSFVINDVARGHHPGWCPANTNKRSRDAALQAMDINKHLKRAITADHAMLDAELDQLGLSRDGE